jgi:hypothetical protein
MYLGDLGGTITHVADDLTPLPFVVLPANETKIFGYFNQWDTELQWTTSDGKALPAEGYSNSDWMTQSATTNALNNRPKFGGELYGTDVEMGNNSNFQFILRAFNRQVLFMQQYGIQIVGGDNAATNNILSTSLDGTVLLRLLNDRNLGLGPSLTTSFGGGKGVLFFANALTVPAGNPTSGVWMWVEGGLLKIKNSSGVIQTSHIWPDTLPLNSGIGNPAGISAPPIPMPFRQIFHKETLTYAYLEDDMPDVFVRTPFVSCTPITLVSASPNSARVSVVGSAMDWGNRTRLGGYFKKGQTIKWDLWFQMTFADDTAGIEFRSLFNATSVVSSGITFGTVTGVANSDKTLHIEISHSIKSLKAGATMGKMDIVGQGIMPGAAGNPPIIFSFPSLVDVDFDDTLDITFDVDAQWTAPDGLSQMISKQKILSIIG